MQRVDESVLSDVRAAIRLAGHHLATAPADFWEQALAQRGKESGVAVEVECGTYGVPGLSQSRTQSGVFEALVQASEKDMRIIGCESLRVVIAFKWKAFGHARWLRQIAFFAAFASSFTVGISLINHEQHMLIGMALFAFASLLNLCEPPVCSPPVCLHRDGRVCAFAWQRTYSRSSESGATSRTTSRGEIHFDSSPADPESALRRPRVSAPHPSFCAASSTCLTASWRSPCS